MNKFHEQMYFCEELGRRINKKDFAIHEAAKALHQRFGENCKVKKPTVIDLLPSGTDECKQVTFTISLGRGIKRDIKTDVHFRIEMDNIVLIKSTPENGLYLRQPLRRFETNKKIRRIQAITA